MLYEKKVRSDKILFGLTKSRILSDWCLTKLGEYFDSIVFILKTKTTLIHSLKSVATVMLRFSPCMDFVATRGISVLQIKVVVYRQSHEYPVNRCVRK